MKGRTLRGLTVALLALSLTAGDKPPGEFRIFGPGVNSTRKGPVVFDELAARAVMAAYTTHGTDIMVDLEHLSLDDEAPNYDPDARAWLRLELRPGPELWATGVRWTPDGDARLRAKTQRYISPAMRVDTKSRRVLELVNIALCAMPATDRLTPLVAAARGRTATRGTMFNPKLLAALGLADDASDDDVAKAMADAMKDPAKMAAMLSGAFDADDKADAASGGAGDGDGDGDETEEEKRTRMAAPKPGAAAAAPAAGAPAGGAPVKKVTTEYHKDSPLAAELLALRLEVNESKIRGIILANRQKFTPALETWALSAFAADPEGLTLWLKAAPVLSTATHTEKRKRAAGAAGSVDLSEVKLTQADLDLCTLTGTDPAAKLKFKRELAAAGNAAATTRLIDEET